MLLQQEIQTVRPVILKAQKTIFVKTGEYLENRPIRVPEDTAVVGDELRSARIKRSPTLTLVI